MNQELPRGSTDSFGMRALPLAPDTVAPDGTDVRALLALAGGSMAHLTLGVGGVSTAVAHRSVVGGRCRGGTDPMRLSRQWAPGCV